MSNYASGEVPMVGDRIMVVDIPPNAGIKFGEVFAVKAIDQFGDPLTEKDNGCYGYYGWRFRLVSRAGGTPFDPGTLDCVGVFEVAKVVDSRDAEIARLRDENKRLRLRESFINDVMQRLRASLAGAERGRA